MIESVCIFEDQQYRKLLPLVYVRPVYDVRCGIQTLGEKIRKRYPKIPIALHSRSYLADVLREQNPDVRVNELQSSSCLFINGRVIADDRFAERVRLKGNDTLYVNGETVVAARLSGSNLQKIKDHISDVLTFSDITAVETKPVDVMVITYPWDLVNNNGKQIIADFEMLKKNPRKGNVKRLQDKVHRGAHLVNEKNIFLDDGASVKAGAVLDAENGPIVIGKDTIIYPNATIEGPAFIGHKSLIKIGAKIYENTTIGEVCKVGGEVEASIIHSYSNKQHDGFLGHAYLGMWVNLGADTNNSDLKNNYGTVKVHVDGNLVDSGSQFVGLTMADHSKSAVNTMFNTGSVVGVSCNVFGAGFPPKYLPSFSWGGAEGLTTYDIERSVEVATRVMARRKIEMTDVQERLFRHVFDMTSAERERHGREPSTID